MASNMLPEPLDDYVASFSVSCLRLHLDLKLGNVARISVMLMTSEPQAMLACFPLYFGRS